MKKSIPPSSSRSSLVVSMFLFGGAALALAGLTTIEASRGVSANRPEVPTTAAVNGSARSNNAPEDPSLGTTASPPLEAAALSFVVNDTGDAADNQVGNGICDSSLSAGDQCTLRAAIQETNANGIFDSDTITAHLC